MLLYIKKIKWSHASIWGEQQCIFGAATTVKQSAERKYDKFIHHLLNKAVYVKLLKVNFSKDDEIFTNTVTHLQFRKVVLIFKERLRPDCLRQPAKKKASKMGKVPSQWAVYPKWVSHAFTVCFSPLVKLGHMVDNHSKLESMKLTNLPKKILRYCMCSWWVGYKK